MYKISVLSLANLFRDYNHKYNLLVKDVFMTMLFLVKPINNAMDKPLETMLTVGLTLTVLILHLTFVFRGTNKTLLPVISEMVFGEPLKLTNQRFWPTYSVCNNDR